MEDFVIFKKSVDFHEFDELTKSYPDYELPIFVKMYNRSNHIDSIYIKDKDKVRSKYLGFLTFYKKGDE